MSETEKLSAQGGPASGGEITIHSAGDWPDQSRIKNMEEPWVSLEVIAPSNQMGKLMEILKSFFIGIILRSK